MFLLIYLTFIYNKKDNSFINKTRKMRTYSLNLLQKVTSTNILLHINNSLSRGIRTSNTIDPAVVERRSQQAKTWWDPNEKIVALHSYNLIRKYCERRQYQTTVDAADVYRHSQLMKTWWDINGPMKQLHSLNGLRLPFIKDGLFHPTLVKNLSACLKGKKILDVGCGGGILSEGLAKLGADVTGIDASKELIELAQYHSSKNESLTNNRPIYINTTIEEHCTINSEKYDAVVASEIIEHVFEKELFVESCVRATKPNGKLFFTTPTKTRIAQFFIIFVSERVLNKIPKDTHQYEKFMTPNELESMLQTNNCMVETTRGLVCNPLTNNWQWTNHKLFMFAMQAVKSDKFKENI